MIIENNSDVGLENLFELNNVPCGKRKLNWICILEAKHNGTNGYELRWLLFSKHTIP
jgi:hypothetical protein